MKSPYTRKRTAVPAGGAGRRAPRPLTGDLSGCWGPAADYPLGLIIEPHPLTR
jgi:hypothetical protein